MNDYEKFYFTQTQKIKLYEENCVCIFNEIIILMKEGHNILC